MQTEIISTRGANIRGADAGRQIDQRELEPLAQTHLIFNRFICAAAEEIIGLIKSAKSGAHGLSETDLEQLTGFLRVAFAADASAGNHLLTRLVQSYGKDNSDRGVIEQVRKFSLKELEALPAKFMKKLGTSLAKQFPKDERAQVKNLFENLGSEASRPALRAALRVLKTFSGFEQNRQAIRILLNDTRERFESEQARVAQLLKDSDTALKLLERRKTEGYAPWRDLGAMQDLSQTTKSFCRIADLPESWQRQVFQAAIEALKSHVNLQRYVSEQKGEWKAALGRLEQIQDVSRYREVRANLLQTLGEDFRVNRLTPPQLIKLVTLEGDRLNRWRDENAPALEPQRNLESISKVWGRLSDADKKSVAREFRADFARVYPEIWAVLQLHRNYERLTKREPQAPSLTIPTPFENPKHVMWSAAQWGKIVLPGEDGNPRGKDPKDDRILVELPTLVIDQQGKVGETMKWYTISADPRLMSIRRRPERDVEAARQAAIAERDQRRVETGKSNIKAESCPLFEAFDLVTDRYVPVHLGAIRLVIGNGRANAPKDVNSLSQSDYYLKFTVKQPASNPPRWVGEYLSGKNIDPLTNEPKLPDKLIVASFLSDVMGPAVFRAAKVALPSYGKRKLEWLPNEPLVVPHAATPEHVQYRRRLERVISYQKWRAVLSILANQKGDKSSRTERRTIAGEIERLNRKKALLWDHVTNLGEDRANRYAGAVVRAVEKLRRDNPGYVIMLVLDHRQERSPSKAAWSKAFNSMVMSAAGARLHNKVVEVARRLDPPIAVVERSPSGTNAVLSQLDRIQVVHFRSERVEQGKPQIELASFSERSVVVTEGPNGIKCREIKSTKRLMAENMIQAAVTPIRAKGLPQREEMMAEQKRLFELARGEILNLAFPRG